LKLKHSLIYILALVFGRISLLRVFNPNVSLFERIILAVATFSIVILTVTWTVYIEDLDQRKFELECP